MMVYNEFFTTPIKKTPVVCLDGQEQSYKK